MKTQKANIFKLMSRCLTILFLGLITASFAHAETHSFVTKWGSYGSGEGQFSGNLSSSAIDSFITHASTNGQPSYPNGVAEGSAATSDETYTFVTKWGSNGSSDGQFHIPTGVAVDSSGNVYVADTGNSRIQKFSGNGAFITKWGSPGSGDGQFNGTSGTLGIAVDSSDNIYVTDWGNNRIQKLSGSGAFISKWGSPGSGDGQFRNPGAVAVDSSGNVYVADTNNGRIQKFSSSGAFLTKWGSLGTGDGQFFGPWGVAVNSSGNVYVVECGNNRTQKFDLNGSFITKWGSNGSGDGQFKFPIGACVDLSGNVYVADQLNDRIQKFDNSGKFITKWGSQGSNDGQFICPLDIAVDSSGNVYVADPNNNRIQKFAVEKELLVQVQGQPEVYLIENGTKRHFTSPEALLWNGHNFSDVTNVTSETLLSYPDGQDISISQPIIDKYNTLGGATVFGAPLGKGELNGGMDSSGISCSYVNFQNGAIDCFKNGQNEGEAYAILNPFFIKWSQLGYGVGILGYPISDMSEQNYSSQNTPYKYQLFRNGTQLGALMWNMNTNNVFEIHGANFLKWTETGYASGGMGLITGDEQEAVVSPSVTTEGYAAVSPYGTSEGYSTFENGCIYWNRDAGFAFRTYGDLNKCYSNIQGTKSDLGSPTMDQIENPYGYGYCEFEKGWIEWNINDKRYEPHFYVSLDQKIMQSYKRGTNYKPEYLLDPDKLNSVGYLYLISNSIIRHAILGNAQLTKQYDELYYTGLEYNNQKIYCLNKALAANKAGNVEKANTYYKDAQRYESLSYDSYNEATQVLLGDIDSAAKTAAKIKEISQIVVEKGLEYSGNPGAAQIVGLAYNIVDYEVDRNELGNDAAIKQFAIKLATKTLIEDIPLPSLGGKTIEEYTGHFFDNNGGKSLLPIIQALQKDESSNLVLRNAIIKALSDASVIVEEDKINSIANTVISNMQKVEPNFRLFKRINSFFR